MKNVISIIMQDKDPIATEIRGKVSLATSKTIHDFIRVPVVHEVSMLICGSTTIAISRGIEETLYRRPTLM